MTDKKSCDKHEKFNYYCEDCRKANKNFQDNQSNDVLYPDAIGKNNNGEIKVKSGDNGDPIPIQRSSGGDKPPRTNRFKYRPFKKSPKIKKFLPILIIIIAFVILAAIFWWFPSWYAGINLETQLYFNKAGGLDFIEYNFLNFWSNQFFFNKTALIGAFVGSIVMSIPPDRILLTIIGTKLRFGKPSRLKALLFWWTAGFVIFYFFGNLIDLSGQFSWTIYLIESGEIEFSILTLFSDAFNVIINPNSLDVVSIFLYSRLVLPIINFTIAILLFRTALKIAQNLYIRRNDYQILSSAFLGGALVLGIIFFQIPTFALDGIQITQIWSIVLGFFGLLSFGIFVYIYSRIRTSRDPRNYVMFPRDKKRVALLGIGILIIIVMPLILSIGSVINLSNNEVYEAQQWDKKYKRQIEWTQLTAGLDMFEERPIINFTESTNSTNDQDMIKQIRQYDQDYAVQTISAKIGTTYEGLADSDIVLFEDKEYWVAPKTVRLNQFAGDAVATNTQLYDHVEGFEAMDTFNGTLVNVTSTFNISESYPIFFGESESPKFLEQQGLFIEGRLGGYDTNILMNTGWEGGIEKNVFNYTEVGGTPDGVLNGLEGFYYTAGLGLWGYVFQSQHQYLINRNIKTRVEHILLPNLRVDNDPYLVFDSKAGRMYYALSIYTSIDIGSYAATPIYRFLGVCTVDLFNGDLQFYQNPNLKTSDDITYPLWKIYVESYNWQAPPEWLKVQMRYPEELFEKQLEANYIYHVEDLKTWRRGDDFHERPEDGDLFYIETNLGEGIEFIGLDLVEYQGQDAPTLAGMYVVRHADHLGKAIFYHTRNLATNRLVGPKTARDSYSSEATKQITLIEGARNGNTLIYPLLNSIYYYVPTYSTVGQIQNLNLAGFIEAFTREVGYGDDANAAYADLGKFPPDTFSLDSNAGDPDFDGDITLNWTASQYANTYKVYQNSSEIAELDATQLTYSVTGLSNGIYSFQIIAENEYGTKNTNTVIVEVELIPITYTFEMSQSFDFPDGLAQFRVELENFNANFSADPIENIDVNLTLYTAHDDVSFDILGLEGFYPLDNSSFTGTDYYEANYTVINNVSLQSGRGLILNGWINCTKGDIILHYKWTVLIDDAKIFTSEIGDIYVEV